MATPIVEPLLASGVTIDVEDGTTLTATGDDLSWYAAASPSLRNTVEVGFLGGNETPDLVMDSPIETLSREYRVTLGFGAGVVDFRSLYKNPHT